jgi:hypothetical protein
LFEAVHFRYYHSLKNRKEINEQKTEVRASSTLHPYNDEIQFSKGGEKC